MDHDYVEMPISKIISNFAINLFKFYDKQRSIDENRVIEICDYLNDTFKTIKIIKIRGVIVFGNFNENYYLIDGQHRYMSYFKFYSDTRIDFNVMCEIIKVKNYDDIFSEFVNINKAVPVPIYNLKPSDAVDEIVSWVKLNYPKALGDKKKIPIMAVNYFREKLTILYSKCKNKDFESMINTIKKIEEFLTKEAHESIEDFIKLTAGYDVKKGSAVRNAVKSMANKLYIGLYYNDNWVSLFQVLNV